MIRSMSVSLPQSQTSFADSLESARGLVPTSQTDITPRNIYGPRSDRSSAEGYGFPPTHSSSSSISSASGYPSFHGYGTSGPGSVAGSVDGSVTDYSSASESTDGCLSSRTLPRPNALLNTAAATLPPAPQSMMGSFNSKVSSSSQKKHKCKVCDKRFTRPSSLQTHMYSHTGEKRTYHSHKYSCSLLTCQTAFACEVPGCGRNFSVVSNLRRHRKVHKGDRGADDMDHGSPEGSWASHE